MGRGPVPCSEGVKFCFLPPSSSLPRGRPPAPRPLLTQGPSRAGRGSRGVRERAEAGRPHRPVRGWAPAGAWQMTRGDRGCEGSGQGPGGTGRATQRPLPKRRPSCEGPRAPPPSCSEPGASISSEAVQTHPLARAGPGWGERRRAVSPLPVLPEGLLWEAAGPGSPQNGGGASGRPEPAHWPCRRARPAERRTRPGRAGSRAEVEPGNASHHMA